MKKGIGKRQYTKHGMSHSPTWLSWHSMMVRCHKPNAKGYADYGGRGIRVCDGWKNFDGFFRDMGFRPEGTTLDRINNDGDYEPSNCRWASIPQQQNNRRDSRYITIDGVTKTVSEWANANGVPVATVFTRLRRGFPVKEAVAPRNYRNKEEKRNAEI